MADSAQTCIKEIDAAQALIATYNADWNLWETEYKRLESLIPLKETDIETKDIQLYNFILYELRNNPVDGLFKGEYWKNDGCGNWPGDECRNLCNEIVNDQNYKTPRGRRPLSIDYFHTHKKHCSWTLPESATYRCYCKILSDSSRGEFLNRAKIINDLITEKTNIQNTILQHAKNMPKLKPIVVNCCDKIIECDNKFYGPNSCYGNLQLCKQSNFNLLDKSKTTELENNNLSKILKIKDDLIPVNKQINELNDSIYNISKELSKLIDNKSISNSILNIRSIYEKISPLISRIDAIRNINNVENEAKQLFDYITTDTTHKRQMISIFDSIRSSVSIIKNIILQAKNTFSNIKIIYDKLLEEDLNINLLKIEQNNILNSIFLLNNYLDDLKIIYDNVNLLNISSQEEINLFIEMYNKTIVLIKNINLEIKNINDLKNTLLNIFNKFNINSFYYNDVKLIYNQSLNNINNIIKKISDFNLNTFIENINNIFLKKKNIYYAEKINSDKNKLKIIESEELEQISSKLSNTLSNINLIDIQKKEDKIIIKNDIKSEETSGININIIIIISIVIITIIYFFIKK
jgi:hypothetical protein